MDRMLDYVQRHEREWGNTSYPGRPALADIVAAKVVVFWLVVDNNPKSVNKRASQEMKVHREIITLHKDMREVESHLTRMLLLTKSGMPERRFVRAFIDQRAVRIKAVHIDFAFGDE